MRSTTRRSKIAIRPSFVDGVDGDQTSADSDQAAADSDQAASDRDLASGGDPGEHEFTRDLRDRSAEHRQQVAQGIGRGGSGRRRPPAIDLTAAA